MPFPNLVGHKVSKTIGSLFLFNATDENIIDWPYVFTHAYVWIVHQSQLKWFVGHKN